MKKENQILIDEKTFSTLKMIENFSGDLRNLIKSLGVDPDEFRKFVDEMDLNNDGVAKELLILSEDIHSETLQDHWKLQRDRLGLMKIFTYNSSNNKIETTEKFVGEKSTEIRQKFLRGRDMLTEFRQRSLYRFPESFLSGSTSIAEKYNIILDGASVRPLEEEFLTKYIANYKSISIKDAKIFISMAPQPLANEVNGDEAENIIKELEKNNASFTMIVYYYPLLHKPKPVGIYHKEEEKKS